MPFRSLFRHILLAPFQIAIFFLISLPLAIFAGFTTFFTVVFLSSRLLLVYIELILTVLLSNSSKIAVKVHTPTQYTTGSNQKSPPRSPPRNQWDRTYPYSHSQQSYTAPSSPNISKKRLGIGAYGQSLENSSPPYVHTNTKAGLPVSSTAGVKSSPSTPYLPYPTGGYDGVIGMGRGVSNGSPGLVKHGRKGLVKVAGVGDGFAGDYFSGVGSRS